MTDTVDILRKARAHLAQVGLHKGDFFRDFGRIGRSPCCALGAIGAVSSDPDDHLERFRAGRALEGALEWPHSTFRSVALFNDDPATTLDDVLALFGRAIEAAS